MNYKVSAFSDIGNVRKTNQDCFLCRQGRICGAPAAFLVVADGMGGLSKGELASSMAIEKLEQWWDNVSSQDFLLSLDEISRRLDNAIYDIHRDIFLLEEEICERIGTTLSVLILYEYQVIIKQIGDSRIYVIKDGDISQLTEDQTYENLMIREGKLDPSQRDDQKNQALVNALGVSDELEIITNVGVTSPNTMFLIASDGFYNGVHGLLEDYDWSGVGNLDRTLDVLKKRILDGPAKDNLTAILVKVIN